jgi:hypothetical protein
MDKILVIGIPAILYYYTKIYNKEAKKNEEIEKLNRLTSIEINKLKIKIYDNLSEFKSNICKLNLALDEYNKKMKDIRK